MNDSLLEKILPILTLLVGLLYSSISSFIKNRSSLKQKATPVIYFFLKFNAEISQLRFYLSMQKYRVDSVLLDVETISKELKESIDIISNKDDLEKLIEFDPSMAFSILNLTTGIKKICDSPLFLSDLTESIFYRNILYLEIVISTNFSMLSEPINSFFSKYMINTEYKEPQVTMPGDTIIGAIPTKCLEDIKGEIKPHLKEIPFSVMNYAINEELKKR